MGPRSHTAMYSRRDSSRALPTFHEYAPGGGQSHNAGGSPGEGQRKVPVAVVRRNRRPHSEEHGKPGQQRQRQESCPGRDAVGADQLLLVLAPSCAVTKRSKAAPENARVRSASRSAGISGNLSRSFFASIRAVASMARVSRPTVTSVTAVPGRARWLREPFARSRWLAARLWVSPRCSGQRASAGP